MAEFLRSTINDLSYRVIECGIEVHRHLGPGLFESTYQECLEYELRTAGLGFERRVRVPITYKGTRLAAWYELDLIVQDLVVVEIKSIAQIGPVHDAQLLTYLKLTCKPLGLLMNFNVAMLRQGIRRRLNKDHVLVDGLED